MDPPVSDVKSHPVRLRALIEDMALKHPANVVKLAVEKWLRSNVPVNAEHPLNISFMFFTLEVFQLERFREVRAPQKENMPLISTTLEVSQVERSSDVTAVLSNIYAILVSLAILNLKQDKSERLMHPRNIDFVVFAPPVLTTRLPDDELP